MIKTKVSTQIQRPVEHVFAVVTNVANFPQVYEGILREAEPLGTGPLSEGSAFRITGSFLGRHFESRLLVTAYEPNRLFCVASNWGSIAFQGCYDFEAVEGGTLLTDRHGINPSGLFSVAGSVLVGQLKKQAERNLANIKRLAEESEQ